MTDRGFAINAGGDPGIAGALAEHCAGLGYRAMWTNDTPAAKGLETLANYAKGTSTLDLGVGVIGLDRWTPDDIAADIDRFGLDPERLWLGVGSGFGTKPLTTMRESLPQLREKLPGVKIVLAAMGPKMCGLAGSRYDGAFFNWMTPKFAATRREDVEAGAAEAGRETPAVFGYVRTAVGPDASARLAAEEVNYRSLHPGYEEHFGRLDAPRGTVGVAGLDAGEVATDLATYSAYDAVVVRCLADLTFEAAAAVASAAAPH